MLHGELTSSRTIVGLLLLPLLVLPGILPIFADGSPNTSINYNAESYAQVKAHMKTLLEAKTMDSKTNSMLEQNEQKSINDMLNYVKTYPYQTVNNTLKITEQKRQGAILESGFSNTNSYTNYDLSVKSKTQQLLNELNKYHKDGRNSVPDFVSCEAWHACVKPVQQNNTWTVGKAMIVPGKPNGPIVFKPEFANNTSGIIQNNGTVHNWADLQKYMTENKK